MTVEWMIVVIFWLTMLVMLLRNVRNELHSYGWLKSIGMLALLIVLAATYTASH